MSKLTQKKNQHPFIPSSPHIVYFSQQIINCITQKAGPLFSAVQTHRWQFVDEMPNDESDCFIHIILCVWILPYYLLLCLLLFVVSSSLEHYTNGALGTSSCSSNVLNGRNDLLKCIMIAISKRLIDINNITMIPCGWWTLLLPLLWINANICRNSLFIRLCEMTQDFQCGQFA